jgi:SulP family sulfate permease
VYKLRGPLFFGSTLSFQDLFSVSSDPKDVVVDFMESRVWDHSALEAIDAVAEKYAAVGKTLHLQHLSPDCAALLEKAKDMVRACIYAHSTLSFFSGFDSIMCTSLYDIVSLSLSFLIE